jgi:nicotinamide mononucleotide transporter
MAEILEYLINNQVEIWGFITGILYVILATRQSVWCWPFGIVNVSLYIVVFYSSGLYGDSALQIFYLAMGFYGLYSWLKRKPGNKPLVRVGNTSARRWIILTVLTLISTFVFGYILDNYTDSSVPYADGLTTALGLYATWMTARKLIENWLVWIFTNLLCTGIYFYKELYTTMVFYFILAILALYGYYQWKRQMGIKVI